MIQVLEQLEKQANEMPDLIKIAPQEVSMLKDDLFDLTIEPTLINRWNK